MRDSQGQQQTIFSGAKKSDICFSWKNQQEFKQFPYVNSEVLKLWSNELFLMAELYLIRVSLPF